jgi:hypothetical protein
LQQLQREEDTGYGQFTVAPHSLRRVVLMPFQIPGNRAFTPISIHKNAPPVSGVYGISNAARWILIDESDDIQASLMRHFESRANLPGRHIASGFTFEVCEPSHRSQRKQQLVTELHPAANGNGKPAY